MKMLPAYLEGVQDSFQLGRVLSADDELMHVPGVNGLEDVLEEIHGTAKLVEVRKIRRSVVEHENNVAQVTIAISHVHDLLNNLDDSR